MNDNAFCVYCHTTPSNRKYVGISKSPEKRWNSGRGYAKNYLFARAIKKYGWDNIEHTILYRDLTATDAKRIEKRLIKEWKLNNPKYGFNLRAGGDGPMSKHSRRLMSISRKGNNNCVGRVLSSDTKTKISDSLQEYFKTNKPAFYGRHHKPETIEKLKSRAFSDETRRKMRENHADVSGNKNPSARPIRQLSISGDVLYEYDYAKLAATKYNLDLSSIIKCCRGKVKSCGGYKWEYINLNN